MTARFRRRLVIGGLISAAVLSLGASQLPWLGAMAMLHPFRRPAPAATPSGLEEVTMRGEGVALKAWRGKSEGTRRGTLIYLHGVADHRGSGAGVLERFRRRGFDVIAYDSRAHGQSGGELCGYGFYEKQDLRRVMDTLDAGPVILCGSSLGAAVAMQHAAADPRVSAVIAAECFSDLRTVATERVPFFLRGTLIGKAFQQAEQKGGFRIDDVSPVIAARSIRVPVLLVHGAEDQDTPPAHSKRLLEALRGPKQLILVKGAAHNESLNGGVWKEIETWVEEVMAGDHR